MQLANSKTRYGAISQLFHWLTLICVVAGWLLGQFLGAFPKGPPRTAALFAHMTLGECVALLLVARLAWRLINPPPPFEPTTLGRVLEVAARLNHFALYALLLAVPLVGIVLQLKRGSDLPVFGLWDFQSPLPVDRAQARTLVRVHYYLANALLILAAIHAAAALTHHFVWRDRTLARMLPGVR